MLNDRSTIQTKLSKGIERIFSEVDRMLAKQQGTMNVYLSGATLLLIFIVSDRVYCAWVGDSRALLVHELDHTLVFENLSEDHKPDQPEERRRILSQGGFIYPSRDYNNLPVGPNRIWNPQAGGRPGPGLMMSRSLGDFLAKEVGVISVPTVFKKEIQSSMRFIVLASDGLWEVMDAKEVTSVVRDFISTKNPQEACQALMSCAQAKWRSSSPSYSDDISIIVIFF